MPMIMTCEIWLPRLTTAASGNCSLKSAAAINVGRREYTRWPLTVVQTFLTVSRRGVYDLL